MNKDELVIRAGVLLQAAKEAAGPYHRDQARWLASLAAMLIADVSPGYIRAAPEKTPTIKEPKEQL